MIWRLHRKIIHTLSYVTEFFGNFWLVSQFLKTGVVTFGVSRLAYFTFSRVDISFRLQNFFSKFLKIFLISFSARYLQEWKNQNS